MTPRTSVDRRVVRSQRVVEFCGLPGVGKTSVVSGVAAGLAGLGLMAEQVEAGIDPSVAIGLRIGRKARLIVATAAAHPLTSARAAVSIAVGQRTGADVVARPVQWMVTQALLETARHGSGVRLLDEGLLQAMWSIGLRGDVGGLLGVLAAGDGWTEPDMVVVVEAPLETVRRRLDSRASVHSRTQSLPEAERVEELRRGDELLQGLLEWWRQRRGSEALLRLANPDDTQPDVETVVRAIASPARR